MLKNLKRFAIIFSLILIAGMFANAKVYATTEEGYKYFENLKFKASYDLFVGQKIYAIMEARYFSSNDFEMEVKSSDPSVISVVDNGYSASQTTLIAKKTGTAVIELKLKYEGKDYIKLYKVNVKQLANTKTESKTNDISGIYTDYLNDMKTQVLLANGELWDLNSKTLKLSAKSETKIKKYVYGCIYGSKGNHIDYSIKQGNDNKIAVSNTVTKKSLITKSGIKTVTQFGYVTTNGDYYAYELQDNNSLTSSKKLSKVTNVVGDLLISNGKTYTPLGEKMFDFSIKDVSIDSGVSYNHYRNVNWGLAIKTNNELIQFAKDYSSKTLTYKIESVEKNVNSLLGENIYKTNSGEIKSYNNYNKDLVTYRFTEKINNCINTIKLNAKKEFYINDIKVLDNIDHIHYMSIEFGIILVKTDGSLWLLNLQKASLVKIRDGKDSSKKINSPSNVKATKSGKKNIKLSWKKVDSAVKYTIYRATSKNGSYKKIGNTTSLSYEDKSAKVGTSYYYKLVANCMVSNYDSYKTSGLYMQIPKAPTKLKLKKKSSTKIKVTYKKVSGVTGYEVQYSTSSKLKKSSVKKTTKTSITLKKLKKKKKYYVRVRAYKTIDGKKIYSEYSSKQKITLK